MFFNSINSVLYNSRNSVNTSYFKEFLLEKNQIMILYKT